MHSIVSNLSGFRSIPVCLHTHSRIVPRLVEFLPSLLLELFFSQLMIWNANKRECRNLLDLFFFNPLLLVPRPRDAFLQLGYRLLKLWLRAEPETL